jgi:signal transduction histidine kinase
MWPRLARLPVAAALLVALLVVLAVVQYRWVGQLGEAERTRLRASAHARADAFALAFDRELTRAFLVLQMEGATRRARDAAAYRHSWEAWRRSAAWPDLVRAVYLAERGAAGGVELRRFDPDGPAFVEAAWPAELAPVRNVLVAAGTSPVLPEVPALLLPVAELDDGPGPHSVLRLASGGPLRLENRTMHVFRRAPGPGAETASTGSAACVVVLLDRDLLLNRILPELARRHLAGAEGLEYDALVRPRTGGPAVFRTEGAPEIDPARADATAPLLDVRFDEIDASILGAVPAEPGTAAPPRPFRVAVRLASRPGAVEHGRWQLALAHRAGSVDRAVDAARYRNLAASFGVLVVLGAGIVLLVASSQRARHLAESQVAFVAGVTHELRTPLAVIQSAAENLADGVVADAPQVRRYGTLIRDEGRRLAGMVEDALLYAGADPRRRGAADGLVAVGDVVDRGVAAALGGGPDVERDVAPDLPPVRGDAAALARAVQNLVANARKHAGPWVAVRARRVPEDAAVAITVEDKGPGLDAEELRRLGEPFFRGRRARETQVAGSGLGLAVVRQIAAAHGGRLDVRSGPGEGSAFTLVLPAP